MYNQQKYQKRQRIINVLTSNKWKSINMKRIENFSCESVCFFFYILIWNWKIEWSNPVYSVWKGTYLEEKSSHSISWSTIFAGESVTAGDGGGEKYSGGGGLFGGENTSMLSGLFCNVKSSGGWGLSRGGKASVAGRLFDCSLTSKGTVLLNRFAPVVQVLNPSSGCWKRLYTDVNDLRYKLNLCISPSMEYMWNCNNWHMENNKNEQSTSFMYNKNEKGR